MKILYIVAAIGFIFYCSISNFSVPTGAMENTLMVGDKILVNKFTYGLTTPLIIPILKIPLPYFKFPGFNDPKQGDVIVFIYPGDRDQIEPNELVYYLKRCVATAGDVLEIKNKVLFVNGEESKLPENGKNDYSIPEFPGDKFRTFPPGRNFTRDNYGPLRIPKKGDIIDLNVDNFDEWEIFISRESHKIIKESNNIFIDDKKTSMYIVENNYCFTLGDNRDNSADSRYHGFVPYNKIIGSPMFVYWSSTNSDRIGTSIK
jgi:signal peptidase I